MSAAGARHRLARCHLDVLPLISREVIDRCLICSIALLEPSENDHLSRLKVDNTCMLIPCHDLVSPRLNYRPAHRSQVQIVELIGYHIVLIMGDIAPKEVHVILVDT